MPYLDGVSYRGKDLEKVDIPWEKREVVHTFEDEWTIEWVQTPIDLQLEGDIVGHCAQQHAHWVAKEVEYLFSLRNPHGTPKATAHLKAAEWVGKEHPDDAKGPFQWGWGRGKLGEFSGTVIDGLPCGLNSTYYDYVGTSPEKYDRVTFNGKELCVISVPYQPEYSARFIEWLDGLNRVKGTRTLNSAGYYEDEY